MMSSGKAEESDAEFNARYEAYFNRPDIDGWEVRKAMGDLAGMDLIPEPTIVAAALRACRRLNDYALTTRILEVVKCKCGNKEAEIWPYLLQVFIIMTFLLMVFNFDKKFHRKRPIWRKIQQNIFFLRRFSKPTQELRPTLDELGISTPEDLGYDKPELMLQNPYEM